MLAILRSKTVVFAMLLVAALCGTSGAFSVAAPGWGSREAGLAGMTAAIPPLGTGEIFGNPASAALAPYGLNAGCRTGADDIRLFHIAGGLPGMRVSAVELFFSFRYLSFGDLTRFTDSGLEGESFSAAESVVGVHGATTFFGHGGAGISVEALSGTLGQLRAQSVRFSAGVLRRIGSILLIDRRTIITAGMVLSDIEIPLTYYGDGEKEPGRGRGAAGVSFLCGRFLLTGECAAEYGGHMEYAGSLELCVSGGGSDLNRYPLLSRGLSRRAADRPSETDPDRYSGAKSGSGNTDPGSPMILVRGGYRTGDLFRTPRLAAGLGVRVGSIQVDFGVVQSDLPGYTVTFSLGYFI